MTQSLGGYARDPNKNPNLKRAMENMTPEQTIESAAGSEFSECGKYRYKLWRIWDDSLPKAMCIGLNPSTANAVKNDPTITNLAKMLKLLGYGGFYMMNLFAFISSKPEDLLTCENPIGENDGKLKEVEAMCDCVIVCWGNFKEADERISNVLPEYLQAGMFSEMKLKIQL